MCSLYVGDNQFLCLPFLGVRCSAGQVFGTSIFSVLGRNFFFPAYGLGAVLYSGFTMRTLLFRSSGLQYCHFCIFKISFFKTGDRKKDKK